MKPLTILRGNLQLTEHPHSIVAEAKSSGPTEDTGWQGVDR